MTKIAIIGSGISGLSCAHYLTRAQRGGSDLNLQVFEAAGRIGGHTATVDVTMGGRRFAIDTGFIVYNDWTYPNFIELMDDIGVASKPSNMSFSMTDRDSGLEYAGSGISALFAQRRNALSPRFLGMLKDIVRFNREAVADLDSGAIAADLSLARYLEERRYGAAFKDYYLVPMGAAIWSADTATMMDFPLQFFVRFFRNHGLLSVRNRPQWRVIEGGSRAYLQPLTASFADRIRTSCPIRGVRRLSSGVEVIPQDGPAERFDKVVFACHSDQALAMLLDPTPAEREILGRIPYQNNEVVLHTDTRMLPQSKRAWSSWNYQRLDRDQRAVLTYNMNILQGLDSAETFCVTLNNSEAINPCKVLGRFNYSHPVFTVQGVRAQARWGEINGDQTWFCGAYWRNGFHEDGVFSARRVSEAIVAEQQHAQITELPRVGSAA